MISSRLHLKWKQMKSKKKVKKEKDDDEEEHANVIMILAGTKTLRRWELRALPEEVRFILRKFIILDM